MGPGFGGVFRIVHPDALLFGADPRAAKLIDCAAGGEFSLRGIPGESGGGELLDDLSRQFPKLGAMRKSMLAAVGVDYQTRDYRLKAGDEVSLFPPVQGG